MAACGARKTGAEVSFPLYNLQPLKQVLDIQPKVGPTIFTNHTGKGWGVARLHKAMAQCREKSDADDLHWHDLRGTLVWMLARGGCSEIQIAAITGHSVINSQVGGYLHMEKNLAIEAYSKLDSMLSQNPTNYLRLTNLFY